MKKDEQLVKIFKLINVYTALMEYNETRDKEKFNIYKSIIKYLRTLI